jgi:ubiquinone biosynthesis protein COQ4
MDVLEDWIRDSHDLWHVVTGYHGDLIGEAALLAFSFAQTWNPGVGFIVAAAMVQTGRLRRRFRSLGLVSDVETTIDPRVLMVQGLIRGMRAEWLVAQDWEALLPLPLEQVRARLGVGEPPVYKPVRTTDVPDEVLAP